MKKYPLLQIIKVEFALLGFRVLSFLPMKILYILSCIIEAILYRLISNGIFSAMKTRYNITMVNLELCFPDKNLLERLAIARQCFRESILVYLNYGLLFNSSPQKLRSRIKCIGLEQFKQEYSDHPTIVVIPHYCAFDLALNRVSQDVVFCSSYKQVDNYFYEKLRQARLRFVSADEQSVIYPAQGSIAPIIRSIKRHIPFFYLPDLDYGEENSVLITFLAHHSRATLNTVPRLVRLTGAHVYTCDIYRHKNHFVFEFIGPLGNINGEKITEEVCTISRSYENQINKHPEHYRWYFPIFTTQPELKPGAVYNKNFFN